MIDVNALSAELAQRGERHALATVVRVDRPVSAHPGDRAVVDERGRLTGWVGGSCSEPIVVREALAVLRDGNARLVRIRPPGAAAGPPQPGVVVEVTSCASEGGLDVFVEPRGPAPHLVIFGASVVAATLARLAGEIGYRVTTVTEPGEGPAGELGSDDAVVVATMNRFDEDALGDALGGAAGYVGLVASRARAATVRDRLRARGVSEQDLERVHAPAGIDLGPCTQEEIAVAILADIVRTRRVRGPEREPLCPPEAVDPVCGMTVAATEQAPAVEHGGVTYRFCSEHCRRAFAADPGTYLAHSGAPEET